MKTFRAPKSLAAIQAVVAANLAAHRPAYAGLSVAEIGEYNRSSMADAFGKAEPLRQGQWSEIG